VSKTDLIELSASDARAQIARGAISAEEYTQAFLDRVAAVEKDVQAFIQFDPDYALTQARTLDAHRSNGRAVGPLHGIPVAIKDIFDTKDFPTGYGSPIYAGHRPGSDSAAVARLRAAGAVILGKTVTTEFAYFHPGKTRIRTTRHERREGHPRGRLRPSRQAWRRLPSARKLTAR